MNECQNIEWKESWHDEYLKWICGFANTQGGRLYIGCDDKGNVVGVKDSHKLLEDIPNKIRQTMGIVVDVNLLEENGKDYIEIVIPAYPVAISCNGVYHYRSGSTKQVMTGPQLESFILRKRGATWDNMPLPGFTLNDIDDTIVDRFRKLAVHKGRMEESVLDESKEELMERLQMTNAGYYTNAAMLLFSRNPDRWQLGAYTKIGFFETDADLLYQDEIHGSILDQIDQIIEVIHLKYMKAKITYEGLQRIERYFVPDAALREALLNALCHKKYESGVPIQVSVYDNRLYIANCGSLPEDWTAENLMQKHVSRPYNTAIAHAFYLAGYIENWGRGVEKICQACEEDGVPQPEYTVHPGDIMIKFTAPEDRVIKVTDRVTDNERRILILLSEDPGYTMMDMSEKLSVSRKTVARCLKSLKEKGYIERVGTDRKGYWALKV